MWGSEPRASTREGANDLPAAAAIASIVEHDCNLGYLGPRKLRKRSTCETGVLPAASECDDVNF